MAIGGFKEEVQPPIGLMQSGSERRGFSTFSKATEALFRVGAASATMAAPFAGMLNSHPDSSLLVEPEAIEHVLPGGAPSSEILKGFDQQQQSPSELPPLSSVDTNYYPATVNGEVNVRSTPSITGEDVGDLVPGVTYNVRLLEGTTPVDLSGKMTYFADGYKWGMVYVNGSPFGYVALDLVNAQYGQPLQFPNESAVGLTPAPEAPEVQLELEYSNLATETLVDTTLTLADGTSVPFMMMVDRASYGLPAFAVQNVTTYTAEMSAIAQALKLQPQLSAYSSTRDNIDKGIQGTIENVDLHNGFVVILIPSTSIHGTPGIPATFHWKETNGNVNTGSFYVDNNSQTDPSLAGKYVVYVTVDIPSSLTEAEQMDYAAAAGPVGLLTAWWFQTLTQGQVITDPSQMDALVRGTFQSGSGPTTNRSITSQISPNIDNLTATLFP